MPYANNKDADQPAHPRSLMSAFVVRCLDNIIPLVSIPENPSLYLAFVAAQVGLSHTWSQTPEDRFSRDEAHKVYLHFSRLVPTSRFTTKINELTTIFEIHRSLSFPPGTSISPHRLVVQLISVLRNINLS